MKTAGLWMHLWDVWSDGLDSILGYARDSHLNVLYPATSYHSGWFIHPHAAGRRVWMPQDGVLYFRPEPATWAGRRLQPLVADICQDDLLARLCEGASAAGLAVSSWTVCCHNSALGLANPDLTVRNCFGDSYPHALCPSHPEVRAYVENLVRSLARGYSLRTVQLEAPEYLGFRHGHHHERLSVPLDAVAQRLFDLSFAASDLAMGHAAGLDGERIRRQVAGLMQAYLDAAPDLPADWPPSWEAACEQIAGLRQYVNAQTAIVSGLVESCRRALDGTATRLEGFVDAPPYQVVTLMCYGQPPAEVDRRVRAARSRLEPHQELQVGLRVGFGEVASAAALRELVAAADAAGADGVLFYNYSEMSRANLSWIGPAVAGLVAP